MPQDHASGIQALLFDLDGTLLDAFDQYAISLIAALKHFHLPTPSRERVRELMGSSGDYAMLSLGVLPEQLREAQRRWVEWAQPIAYLARPFPGVVPLLKRLRQAGYRLGIVTSRPHRSVEITPAAMELASLVDLLVARDDTVEGKPHPEPVLYALNQLALAPEQAVYVGDAHYDIEAGQRAGCLTILATWDGVHLDPDGKYQPHFTVATPEQLADLVLNGKLEERSHHSRQLG
ncbi:MAG: HAD family hydrolase [Chloroflexi bacterium]|nr:HAD family hydrolase [Chloroflexota bacterium]